MSLTIAPALPYVNPTPAEIALADRLAFVADGGALNDYRADWSASEPTGPSLEDEMAETGYQIGRATGQMIGVAVAFPHYSAAAILAGGLGFTMGRNAGIRKFAHKVGYDLAIDGKPCVRPETLNRYFDREFVAGWEAGSVERADREAEMASYFARLDWEFEYDREQRELEKLAREAGGWDRVSNLALV